MMLSKLHAFNGSQVAAVGYCRFYQIWMEPYGKRLLLVNIKVSDVITTHHHQLRVKQFLAVPKSGDEWKQLGLLRKWQITVIAQRQPLTSDKHPEGEAAGASVYKYNATRGQQASPFPIRCNIQTQQSVLNAVALQGFSASELIPNTSPDSDLGYAEVWAPCYLRRC